MSDVSKTTTPTPEQLLADVFGAADKPAAPPKPEPPRKLPTINDHLVAFIDILGFSGKIIAAKTDEDLKQIYEQVRLVQRELEKPSAVKDPGEQEDVNLNHGKKVIALSDGVVVAVTADCKAGPIMTPYDLFMLEIWTIIIAQARCVARGIFLRGGIGRGTFFFEDDILLSPPLVTAYRLESKCAVYPVILVDAETHDFLFSQSGRSRYKGSSDPSPRYFRPFKSPAFPDAKLYMLDYLSVTRDEDHGWIFKEDYEAYRNASDEEKSAVLYRRDVKNAAWFLGLHKKALLAAYHTASRPEVKEKYLWLMHYHNECVPDHEPLFSQHLININAETKT
jgi:hypothetical protein